MDIKPSDASPDEDLTAENSVEMKSPEPESEPEPNISAVSEDEADASTEPQVEDPAFPQNEHNEPTDVEAATAPNSDQNDKTKKKSRISKKMGLIIGGSVAAFFVLISILGSVCFHFDWNPATCTRPKTCSNCGQTEGEKLGHSWEEATCTEPKTCSRCGKELGKALGHKPSTWTVQSEATCSTEGKETSTCSRCGEDISQSIPKLDHLPGDWVVTTQPTASTDGTRVRNCTVCGEEVESETFSMSPEEIAAAYKAECISLSYEDVARNPDQYNGTKVKFTGEVIQVLESSGVYTLRVNVTEGRYYWEDTIMIYCAAADGAPRILEDDILTFYGVMDGITSYESVMGATITLPQMYAAYYE